VGAATVSSTPDPLAGRGPVLAIIGRLPWRVAKTMPQIPHQYTVRSHETEADYVVLFNAIQSAGVDERYNRRRKKYLYPGDGHKYWAMTTSVHQSRILNRMRIEDDLPRLRRERQFDAVEFGEAELNRRAGQG
jgi:hypothetical protein